jgi:hypothetical protein
MTENCFSFSSGGFPLFSLGSNMNIAGVSWNTPFFYEVIDELYI